MPTDNPRNVGLALLAVFLIIVLMVVVDHIRRR